MADLELQFRSVTKKRLQFVLGPHPEMLRLYRMPEFEPRLGSNVQCTMQVYY